MISIVATTPARLHFVRPILLGLVVACTSAGAAATSAFAEPRRPFTVTEHGTTIVYTSDIVDNQQSSKLSFGSHVPAIGDQITVQVSLFGMDPAAEMVTDNNGHVYVRDLLEGHLHEGGDGKDAGLAIFRTVVTRNSKRPFTVTFDSGVTTPDDTLPGRWWTWGVSSHTRPAASDPIDATSASRGVNSTRIPAATAAATTNAWIAFFVSYNRGHDTRPVQPPPGWTTIANNSEDSRHQSGHAFFQVGTAPGDVAPVANVIDIANGQPAEITHYRALLVIYKLAAP